MPRIGPKGSGVDVGEVVGCVVGVIATDGVVIGVLFVVAAGVVAVWYANAATRVLHISTTTAMIRNLLFALFQKVIFFSLPNEVMIGISIAEWSKNVPHPIIQNVLHFSAYPNNLTK